MNRFVRQKKKTLTTATVIIIMEDLATTVVPIQIMEVHLIIMVETQIMEEVQIIMVETQIIMEETRTTMEETQTIMEAILVRQADLQSMTLSHQKLFQHLKEVMIILLLFWGQRWVLWLF